MLKGVVVCSCMPEFQLEQNENNLKMTPNKDIKQ